MNVDEPEEVLFKMMEDLDSDDPCGWDAIDPLLMAKALIEVGKAAKNNPSIPHNVPFINLRDDEMI